MKNLRIGGGLAGTLLAAAVTVAAAQEAPPRPAENCSFLGCLLHSRADGAQPQQAPQAPQAAPAADGAAAPSARAASAGLAAAAEDAVPERTKPKPVPAVTLAADAAEKPRLKALAAARPRHRLHVVAAGADDAELRLAPTLDAASGTNTLHLYSELLHVVAGPAVTTLADLRDKQVSFGPADGPTASVARRAFAAAGVAVKEVALDQSNALDGLATGDIDAVVVLAPQPSPAVAALRGTGLHLVDWPETASLPPGAHQQHLAATTYPALLKAQTNVLAVDAVLTLTPRGERSAAARGLFASLKQRTGALARRGFDRLGADLDARRGRHVASDERR